MAMAMERNHGYPSSFFDPRRFLDRIGSLGQRFAVHEEEHHVDAGDLAALFRRELGLGAVDPR